MPQPSTMVKPTPKKVWANDSSQGQRKGRSQSQEPGPSKSELIDLQVKIDQAMAKCRAEVNGCMSDWVRRLEGRMASRQAATSKYSPPPIPALPDPEMMNSGSIYSETPAHHSAIPGVPEMVDVTDESEVDDLTSQTFASRRKPTSRPATAPVRHVIPNDQVKMSRPQRLREVKETAEQDRRQKDRRETSGSDIEYLNPDSKVTAPKQDEPASLAIPGDSEEDEARSASRSRAVFMSPDDLKEQMKANIVSGSGDTSEKDLLHETGICRTIAVHPAFEYMTLSLIGVNAIWMGYDTDANEAATLLEADIQFVIMENVFCAYFTLEWIVRFFAFKRKLLCYKDRWFVFDTCLVLSMIFETWLLSLILITTGASLEGSKALRWFRLGRLTRLARMARLLRAFPELVIMVKAIVISMKTVVYALVLLLGMVYVFSIAFTQLMDGKTQPPGTASYDNFRTVGMSMNTLLLSGALPDQAGLITQMMDESPVYYLLMLAFLFIASLTVMNMLIGIVCDVITAVSEVERESILITGVKDDLHQLMKQQQIGDETGLLKRDEYERLLMTPQASKVLENLGVDIFGLVDLSDFLFSEDKGEVSFTEFMDVVLELRGSNTATVKNIIELGKLVTNQIQQVLSKIEPDGVIRTSKQSFKHIATKNSFG